MCGSGAHPGVWGGWDVPAARRQAHHVPDVHTCAKWSAQNSASRDISDDFVKLVCDAKPEQVTLVPDPPHVLTSNAGWTVTDHADLLKNVLAVFKAEGIRTSLFIETDEAQIHAAADVGADRIELYTESFAVQHAAIGKAASKPFAQAAAWAHEAGLGVNAGHDLNLQNLRDFAESVPHLAEVSIGHALIADALYLGMSNAVAQYRACLTPRA